jgi:hypothetical protein
MLPAQLLSDLCTEIKEQSRAFKTFNSDLPSRLKQSIAEATGASFDKIAAILGDLDHSMRQSVALRLEAGDEQPAPSRSHHGQSNEPAQSFASQDALNNLISVVREATASQAAMRDARDEQLAGMLNQLMDRLQRQTGESARSMEKALATVTVDISNKVMELSAQVAATLEKTTESSSQNVREALREAGSLGSQNIDRLAQLVEARGRDPVDAEGVRMSLYGIAKELSATAAGQGKTTEALQKIATEVNMGVISLSQIAKSIRETHELTVRASSSASGQIESLNDFIRGQQVVWGRIQASMAQYEEVFGKVEGHARDLLTQIARHLAGYSDITEKHFVQLTSAADNFISQATGRLSGSIDELGEQLDELQSALAGITRLSQAVG